MPRHGSGINTGEHQIYMPRFVGERAAQLSDELRILHDWIIRPGGYQGQGCLSWLKPRFKQTPSAGVFLCLGVGSRRCRRLDRHLTSAQPCAGSQMFPQ